jgi:tetratricopeptide (TPR) repeat protein
MILLLLLLQDPSPEELFKRAESLRKELKDADAIVAYQQLLKRRPDDLPAHLGYQKVMWRLKKRGTLLTEYQALLKEKNLPWCYFLCGRLLHDAVKEEELYRKGLEIDPKDIQLRKALCGVLAAQQKITPAVEQARKVLELNPNDFSAHKTLIRLLVDADKELEAVEEYRNFLKAKPNDPLLRLGLAYSLMMLGNWDEAQKLLEAAVRQSPDDSDTLTIWAMFLRKRKRTDDAVAAFRKLLRKDPDDPVILRELGITLFILRKDAKGIDGVKRAAVLEPDDSRTWTDLGSLQLMQKDYDAAEQSLYEAIELNRFNDSAAGRLGSLFLSKQDYPRAVEWLKRAIQINGREAEYHQCLAEAYKFQDKPDEARKSFETASTLKSRSDFAVEEADVLDPNQAESRRRVQHAEHLLFSGDIEKAVRQLAIALELDPRSWRAIFWLARVHERRGEWAKAIDLLNRLLPIVPADRTDLVALVRWRLADDHYPSGKEKEAVELYRQIHQAAAEDSPTRAHLGAMLRCLEQAKSDSKVFRIDAVRIKNCAHNNYCAPESLGAVCAFWKIPLAPEYMGRELVKEGHGPITQTILNFLKSKGVAVRCFYAKIDEVKALLQQGYPLILLTRILDEGAFYGHATVLCGFDDRRGVFLLEDSNWFAGLDCIPYARVEGHRVLLVGPAEKISAVKVHGEPSADKLNRAEEEIRKGAMDQAEELLKMAILDDQGDARGFYYLGVIREHAKDVDGAIRWYQKGIQRSSVDVEIRTKLAALHIKRKDDDKAKAELRPAIAAEPGYAAPYCLLALLASEHKEDHPEMLRLFRLAIELGPENLEVRLDYARALKKAGRLEDAVKELTTITLLAPQEAEPFLELAFVHKERQDMKGAVAALKKYIELENDLDKSADAENLLKQWSGK